MYGSVGCRLIMLMATICWRSIYLADLVVRLAGTHRCNDARQGQGLRPRRAQKLRGADGVVAPLGHLMFKATRCGAPSLRYTYLLDPLRAQRMAEGLVVGLAVNLMSHGRPAKHHAIRLPATEG